jgi:hypothetical protein
MKISRRLLKFVAVTSSTFLIGLYVYDRAGGNLLERLYPDASAKNEHPMMSSSKVKMMLPVGSDAARGRNLMPGPKSAPVFLEPTPTSVGTASPQSPIGEASDDPFSSRAAAPNLPAGVPTPANPPVTQTSPPAQAEHPQRRTLIHGSKSAAPLIPAPNDSANSAPNLPPQALQQQQAPAKRQYAQPKQTRKR